MDLFLNGTQANYQMNNGETVNITTTLSLSGTVDIYNNSVWLTSDPITYWVFNFIGDYNITAVYARKQNYSEAVETLWLNVTDGTSPTISIDDPVSNGDYDYGTIISISGTADGTGTNIVSLTKTL